MKNTLYTAIKSVSTLTMTTNCQPTNEFWISAFEYSQRFFKSYSYTPYAFVLTQAYQCTYEDLIHDSTIKLAKKYEYLIQKYNDLCVFSEDEKIKRFYGIVNAMLSNMIKDKFKKISNDITYTEYDHTTGKYLTKTGKVIKPTYYTTSLNQVIFEDDSAINGISLLDVLASPLDSEDLIIAQSLIEECMKMFYKNPYEMFSFICLVFEMKISLMAENLISYNNKEYFFRLCREFSKIFNITSLNDYINYYSTCNFSYTRYKGNISLLKKRLSYERQRVKAKCAKIKLKTEKNI